MNGVDFYNLIREKFADIPNIGVAAYVNPSFHAPEMFEDVQFISASGGIVAPLNPRAAHLVLIGPLAGPFYELPIEGFLLGEVDGVDGKASFISIVVRMPDGNLRRSCGIFIPRNIKFVASTLKEICVDKWYRESIDGSLSKVDSLHELVPEGSTNQDSRLQS